MPDLLGVELEARVVRGFEVVAEPPRRGLLGRGVRRQEPQSEAQVALGKGFEEGEAPGAEALGDLGGDGLGDHLFLPAVAPGGEKGEGEPLGAGAGAAPGVGDPLQEELARGGVGQVVDDAPQEEGRGGVEALRRGCPASRWRGSRGASPGRRGRRGLSRAGR